MSARVVDKITVDTALFPEVVINDPLNSANNQSGDSWLLRWLKPKIVIYSPFGNKTIAPYGSPTGNELNIVWQGATVLLLLIMMYFVFKKKG